MAIFSGYPIDCLDQWRHYGKDVSPVVYQINIRYLLELKIEEIDKKQKEFSSRILDVTLGILFSVGLLYFAVGYGMGTLSSPNIFSRLAISFVLGVGALNLIANLASIIRDLRDHSLSMKQRYQRDLRELN